MIPLYFIISKRNKQLILSQKYFNSYDAPILYYYYKRKNHMNKKDTYFSLHTHFQKFITIKKNYINKLI